MEILSRIIGIILPVAILGFILFIITRIHSNYKQKTSLIDRLIIKNYFIPLIVLISLVIS